MILSGVHRDIYTQATDMRAEVQAELILSAFSLFQTSAKANTPALGPLLRRANAKMSMILLNKPQLIHSAAA